MDNPESRTLTNNYRQKVTIIFETAFFLVVTSNQFHSFYFLLLFAYSRYEQKIVSSQVSKNSSRTTRRTLYRSYHQEARSQ